ncbi:amidase [Nocardia veterana]|uniref:amidase n=1 Tax=Nocardia veterana TaxID=132249 RepID=A0A7X6M3X1_9NOCA|nr:amidase [Nocardia veterana]NKY89808.1 amidase [Nocardia veterana]
MTDQMRTVSVRHLLSSYATRDRSASEVIDSAISILGTDARERGAVVTVLEESARRRARESDERWSEGVPRALEGVPFGIKDVFDLAGEVTTSGSLVDKDRVAAATAVAVERLLEAGAIPVSKDATTEWAVGGPNNLLTGSTRNPWDSARWAGGSSSGSAASVALGAFPFALASDAGGSIRIPASHCGVTGVKTTAGRVPRTGATPLSWTNETVGPIASSAEDAALMLSVIAGCDATDPQSYGPGLLMDDVENSKPLAQLRIGLPGSYFTDDSDQAVLAGYESQLQLLAAQGVRFVDVDIPSARQAHSVGYHVLFTEAWAHHSARRDRFADYCPVGLRRIARGSRTTTQQYVDMLGFRRALQAEFADALEQVDFLLMPTTPAAAPALDDLTVDINGRKVPMYEAQSRATVMCNLSGVPAVTIPSGFTTDGLPVGMQLVGLPYSEELLLGAAIALQNLTGLKHLTPYS